MPVRILPCVRSMWFVLYDQFFFSCYGDHRDLHSFPTRRSSDLTQARISPSGDHEITWPRTSKLDGCRRSATSRPRSEEHTSELQSQSNLVCRLLLEKKNRTPVMRSP